MRYSDFCTIDAFYTKAWIDLSNGSNFPHFPLPIIGNGDCGCSVQGTGGGFYSFTLPSFLFFFMLPSLEVSFVLFY